MNYVNVSTHTVDVDMMKLNGYVLDVGCRGFDFSLEMSNSYGMKVVALDPDPSIVTAPGFVERYINAGLVHYKGEYQFIDAGNGSRLVPKRGDLLVDVRVVTLAELLETYKFFEVVKLDCEGSEYEILLNWPGPVARQISVEFHEHTNRGKAIHGDDVYERIEKHLGQWYRRLGTNLMDSLWVMR